MTATGANPIEDQEAGSSICPRGWQLPTSNKTNIINGSFDKLVMDGLEQITPIDVWKANQTDITLGNSFGIIAATNGAMLSYGFFPAAGLVYNGSLSNAGVNGYYWSSIVDNSTGAYYLYFNSGVIRPLNGSARYYGFPIRCVASTN